MSKLLLGIAFLWVLSLGPFTVPCAYAKASRAKIRIVSGQVNLNGTPAFADDVLEEGDKITTGPTSYCAIIFDDKNAIYVSENTELTLHLAAPKKSLDLVKGAVSSLLRRLARVRDRSAYRYTVNTPTAICGVRGTAFYVKVESPEKTYVCLCNGRLEISGVKGGEKQSVTASHHRAFWVTKKGGVDRITDATGLYHTDGDMESMATLIGETMDWATPE